MRKSGVDARACAVLVLFIALSCCGADAESKPAPSPRLRAAIERLDTSQKQYYEQMKSVMPYYDDGGNRLELEDKNKDWETTKGEAPVGSGAANGLGSQGMLAGGVR